MKFFIDTANIDEITEAGSLGILDGVTTNPSLMAKEGISGEENIIKHYETICNIVDGHVSAEVIATDMDGMIDEGLKLASIHSQIVVKVPATANGIKAINHLSHKGIKTNCTLVFSTGQAILAAKAGATYVSPFIGRIDDMNYNGMDLIDQMVQVYHNYEFETQILAASIRNTRHIIECAEAGVDVVTSPLKPLKGLLKHPLTDIGLEKFLADHKKAQQ
ncbi:MAG: fructose-6-phosphate aldolase [Bacteroidales bacterium]|nr:fructose-6-phosphate aldolase [Bacteroidales bacterium]